MPKLMVLLVLGLLQIGVPGMEIFFIFVLQFCRSTKLEILLEGLQSLRELERLENRYETLRALCSSCARDEIISSLELEIAACRSSIARLLLLSRRQEEIETLELELRQDLADLEELELQRAQLLRFEVAELQQSYLEHLEEQRKVAEARYREAVLAYCGEVVKEIEVQQFAYSYAFECNRCPSGLAAAG